MKLSGFGSNHIEVGIENAVEMSSSTERELLARLIQQLYESNKLTAHDVNEIFNYEFMVKV